MNIAVTRVAIVAAGFLAAALADAQEADLVLRNGVIWTVDDANPRAQAVAALRDRIVYVGTDAGVERHIGPGTRVIDLGGKLVTPGFYDNHVHFEGTGRLLYGLNLLDVSTRQTNLVFPEQGDDSHWKQHHLEERENEESVDIAGQRQRK